MPKLTFSEIEQLRATPGKSLLLFITDRCPVGCAHCSVDSRQDSPTITDFELFEGIVQQIGSQPALQVVGISGGEPFVERRGLTLAVDRLADVGKDIVLYTSGVWANTTTPLWIHNVITKASCVFLSTDAFHAESVDDERYVRALEAIAATGAWMVIQVLNLPPMVERAQMLLQRAFGAAFGAYAELHLTTPLSLGRGSTVFFSPRKQPATTFGRCTLLTSPVIRYDGLVSPCCNEAVIMGNGPDGLHARCTSAAEVSQSLDQFKDDTVLNVMSRIGVGALTQHPRFADLAQQRFTDICHLCWTIQERGLETGNSDRILTTLVNLSNTIGV